MSREIRKIVLRCVGPALDGTWMACEPGTEPQYLQVGLEVTTMVPTGNVEWDGNDAAEVWVPKNRLNYWRREHAIEGTGVSLKGELGAG